MSPFTCPVGHDTRVLESSHPFADPRAQEFRFSTSIPVPSDHFSDRKVARWSKRFGFRRTLPLLGYIVRRVVT
jgi:hypothetical protein